MAEKDSSDRGTKFKIFYDIQHKNVPDQIALELFRTWIKEEKPHIVQWQYSQSFHPESGLSGAIMVEYISLNSDDSQYGSMPGVG